MIEELEKYTKDNEFKVITFDGFSGAVIGWVNYDGNPLMVIYSLLKMAQILVGRDGMSFEDAVEYVNYNCSSMYLGSLSPIIVDDLHYICEY